MNSDANHHKPRPPNHLTSSQLSHPQLQWIRSHLREVSHSLPSPKPLALTLTAPLELLNIHNAFHQGRYSAVLEQDSSSLSPENVVAAKVYVLRARIALGQTTEVITEVGGAKEPELKAVKALAEYTNGKTDSAVKAVNGLVDSSSDNATVQVLGAMVLDSEGRGDEALSLLSKHQGNLEA